jgi:sulfur relay (sulfurtransferase) DsrC/TusE family protein
VHDPCRVAKNKSNSSLNIFILEAYYALINKINTIVNTKLMKTKENVSLYIPQRQGIKLVNKIQIICIFRIYYVNFKLLPCVIFLVRELVISSSNIC